MIGQVITTENFILFTFSLLLFNFNNVVVVHLEDGLQLDRFL